MIKCTERYATGWTDARSIFGSAIDIDDKKYGAEHSYNRTWSSPLMPKKKVDAHEYKTEAKDMPIEACRNLWLITYGDGWFDSNLCVEQNPIMWEIGNRLWWAGLIEHDTQTDQYKCKS